MIIALTIEGCIIPFQMRKVLVLSLVLLLAGCGERFGTERAAMQNEKATAAKIIAMEKAALDRWGRGDPSGFLEISSPDVVYFDPMQEKRLDGIEALTRLYESIRGQIHIDRYEILNPRVQLCGDAAVLTFNYVSYEGEKINRWNCTDVYHRENGQWRIIQTHWSVTQPFK